MSGQVHWRNWAGNVACVAATKVTAHTVDEVIDVVQSAAARGGTVRPLGAGHSFSPIAIGTDVLLDISGLSGLWHIDMERGLITVGAGTKLRNLTHALWSIGWALPNMGDIDKQTLAGAIATGTHGTGDRWGSLASAVTSLRIVTADGTVHECSRDSESDLFYAGLINLGAIGVVVSYTLQCVPAFSIRMHERRETWQDVVKTWQNRVESTDHFEFYWFPHTRAVVTKSGTRVRGDYETSWRQNFSDFWTNEVLANGALAVMSEIACQSKTLAIPANRAAVRMLGPRTTVGPMHQVMPSVRRVRFTEMEYAIGRDRVDELFERLPATVEALGGHVWMPIEVRFTPPSTAWLSHSYGRHSCYVAVHQYHKLTPAPYFERVERLMVELGGRPHWGKWHSRRKQDLAGLYPKFDDFLSVRDKVDPERMFTNQYHRLILGD